MQNSCNEMASRLTTGDWVAYESRGDPDQQLGLERHYQKVSGEINVFVRTIVMVK
jgi:hypothetical protein